MRIRVSEEKKGNDDVTGDMEMNSTPFQEALVRIAFVGSSDTQNFRKKVNPNAAACIITLCKILDNILLEKKYTSKTRSIKLSNKLFQDKIGVVPGGAEYMLACNFSYAKMTSSPKNKKSSAKQVESAADANSIQLFREHEARNTLLIGRLHLHEFGKRITQLKVGKNKNELPPLNSFHTIKTVSFSEIRNNIDKLREEYVSWLDEDANGDSFHAESDKEKSDTIMEDTMSILSNQSNGIKNQAKGHEDCPKSEERSLETSKEVNSVNIPFDIGPSKTLSKVEEKLLDDILSNKTSYERDVDDNEKIIYVVAEHTNSALSEKIDNDNSKDALLNQRDDRSAMSHHSHSDIHIREKKVIGDKTRKIRQDNKPEEKSKLIETLTDRIEELKIPFLAEKDDQNVRLGLKLFYSVLIITFYGEVEYMTDAYITVVMTSQNVTSRTVPIPVEALYKLWIGVLHKEGHVLGITCQQMLHSMKAVAIGFNRDCDQDSVHSSLDRDNCLICNFLLDILCVSMLKRHEIDDVDGPHSDLSCTMIEPVEGGKVYGRHLTAQLFFRNSEEKTMMETLDRKAMMEIRARWHGYMVEEFRDCVTGQGFFRWYSIRWLPFHTYGASNVPEETRTKLAAVLLSSKFLAIRFRSCGVVAATLRSLHDAKLLIKKNEQILLLAQTDKDGSLQNMTLRDSGYQLTESIYDSIQNILHDNKQELDSSMKDENPDMLSNDFKEQAKDLGLALHYLGLAFGEAGDFKKELDLLVEALRLKRLSSEKNEIESIADTISRMGLCYRNLGQASSAILRYREAHKIFTNINEKNIIGISQLLHNMGVVYCEKGEFSDSIEYFERSLRTLGKEKDDHPQMVANTLCWLGKVHRERHDYKKSLTRFMEAREIIKSSEGDNSLNLAEIQQNLGVIYDDMDKMEESLNCYFECLKLRRAHFKDDQHNDICETLVCIANIFRKYDLQKSLGIFNIVLNARVKKPLIGKVDGILLLQAYTDVLDVTKEHLELDRKNQKLQNEIAFLLFKTGNVYEKLEQYVEAIAFYNKALKINRIKKNYKSVGTNLNSLGVAHAKRLSYRKAMKCFSDSLLARKTTLGKRHPDVAETLHNMGNCAAKQCDFDKALLCYEESLIIKKLAFGDNSLTTCKTLHNIGYVNEQLGFIDDALKYYQDALGVRTNLLGDNHIDVAFSLHSIGTIFKKQCKWQEAMESFSASLKVKRRHYVESHLSVAETMHFLGLALIQLGKDEEASVYLESSLLTYESKLGTHSNIPEILDSLGSICISKKELDKAYRYLERSLALKRMVFEGDNMSISDTLYLIGKVQGKSGDLEDSLLTFKDATRIRKKIEGPNSLSVAAVINDVGVIQLRKGQHEIAQKCFLEALRIWELHLGDNNDKRAETLVNLGDIEYTTSNFDGAIDKLIEAMNIFQVQFGTDHSSIALVHLKLGKCHRQKKGFEDALVSFEKALSIRTAKFGVETLPVAEIYTDIGSVYLETGDFSKARHFLGEALNTMRSKIPHDNMTAETLYLLGRVMKNMSYNDEALAYFQDALEIRRRRLDTDDIGVADVLAEIGSIYEHSKNYEQSLELNRKALQIRENILGEDVIVADSYHCIGVIEQEIKKFKPALKSFSSALLLYQKEIGDDDLSCAKTMNNIGLVYEAMGEVDEALKYHKEALRIRQIKLGQNHIKIAHSLDNIAGLYQKQKKYEKALKSLKHALKIRTLCLGNDHVEIATTLFGMGILFCDKNDLDKAMDCYEASLEIRKQKVGSSSVEYAQTLHNIGSVCALKQDYRNALTHWKNSLEKYRKIGLSDDHHMVASAIGNIEMATNMLKS